MASSFMAGCRWDVWNILIIVISNQVVLHHTVHKGVCVQKGVYHAPPYTDPFMAACPAVGCIILNGHVGVSGCLATAAVSESNESTEKREHVRTEGWISQTSESGSPLMRCAAHWNRSVAPSCMLQVWFCLNPPVSGKGKFPHRESERAPERWQTERLLRLSASLLSASFSSTSRHNQAVQPGLMNESKSFRWLQSGDAPTTHVREILLWKQTKKLLIETRLKWECTCLKFDSTFATSDGMFQGLFSITVLVRVQCLTCFPAWITHEQLQLVGPLF